MQAARGADLTISPIDFEHLERQTLGDPAVLREVLALFAGELDAARENLASPNFATRGELAHRIKGAAQGVGAHAVAAAAGALEAAPDRLDLKAALLVRMHEAVRFIAERGPAVG